MNKYSRIPLYDYKAIIGTAEEVQIVLKQAIIDGWETVKDIGNTAENVVIKRLRK